ncbi:hypothetical protein OH805_08440 [Streptomyces sp. NBC_00879]|nr:hypothetical protein OH805_08440 [Streptomyces sp. NBC_00879]
MVVDSGTGYHWVIALDSEARQFSRKLIDDENEILELTAWPER